MTDLAAPAPAPARPAVAPPRAPADDAPHAPDLLVQDVPMPDVDAMVERTFALLADHVPLSLLLDLAGGPHSAELLADEPADTGWLEGR